MSEATIAEVQKYWDLRPCNVRHGRSFLGSPAWSREVTDRKYFVERHIRGFAQFPWWSGRRVLEIGCGIGTDTLTFLQYGAIVDAVDLSLESLTLAKMRCKYFLGSDRPPVRFTHGNAEEIVFAPSVYDLVYSFGVLHHTPHPERILRKAHAALQPGGELRVMLYARRSLKYLLGEQAEAQANCPIARFYSRSEARNLLTAAGFSIKALWQDHIFPWRVKDYVEHRYVKRWPYRFMPRQVFHALEGALGHHMLIVARKA